MHAAQIIGHTINILFYVVIHYMLHFVFFEVQFLAVRQQHDKAAPDFAPHVERGQMLQLNHLANHIADALKKRITKDHEVQGGAAHGLRAAPGRRDEVTQQQVAFETRDGAVVSVGAQQLGQTGA